MNEKKENPRKHQPKFEDIETSREARKMAVLCHLLGVVGFWGPLIVWMNEKDKHKFVYEHGQESINYHISMMGYLGLPLLLCIFGYAVGFYSVSVLLLAHIFFCVEGSLKASQGRKYRYWIAFRLLP